MISNLVTAGSNFADPRLATLRLAAHINDYRNNLFLEKPTCVAISGEPYKERENFFVLQAAQEGQRRLLKQQLKQLQSSTQRPVSEDDEQSQPASGTAGRRPPKGVSPPTASHSHLQPYMFVPPNAHGKPASHHT